MNWLSKNWLIVLLIVLAGAAAWYLMKHTKVEKKNNANGGNGAATDADLAQFESGGPDLVEAEIG